MKLSVVVPSRNGLCFLRKYLPAVLADLGNGGELIVVDDCSDDETAVKGPVEFPEVRFITRQGEPGFCHAVNIGMRESSGDMLLLLNNDVLLPEGALSTLAEELHKAPQYYCAAVPRIRRPDGSDESKVNYMFSRGLASTSLGGDGVPYPSGACSLWRRTSWESLGGLDTIYAPIYWEDADIGARAFKLGMKVLRIPGVEVQHEHAATMRLSPESDSLRERNRFIFMHRHFRTPPARLSTAFWLPLHLLKAALTGNTAFLKGYRSFLLMKGLL